MSIELPTSSPHLWCWCQLTKKAQLTMIPHHRWTDFIGLLRCGLPRKRLMEERIVAVPHEAGPMSPSERRSIAEADRRMAPCPSCHPLETRQRRRLRPHGPTSGAASAIGGNSSCRAGSQPHLWALPGEDKASDIGLAVTLERQRRNTALESSIERCDSILLDVDGFHL